MMTSSAKRRHGGARPGAGRKPAYGEPTRTVRIPESQVPVVTGFLAQLKARAESPRRGATLDAGGGLAGWAIHRVGRHVRAGGPTSGDDYVEEVVDLGRHLVRDPAATFLMRVRGWSMRDAGIADGDELVIDRDVAAEDGRIVVAEVDGELTVKKLKRRGSGWLLQAANPEFADVHLNGKDQLHVWGVVTRVLHTP